LAGREGPTGRPCLGMAEVSGLGSGSPSIADGRELKGEELMLDWLRRGAPSLEEQLRILAEGGIRPRPGVSVDQLTTNWGPEEFEKEPFLLALVALGSVTEAPPYEPFSDNVWHLDTECIEDEGSYVFIAERMRDLAQGDLPVTGITDHLDFEEGVTWLEFELDGRKIHWDIEVEDDWIDPTVLSRFAALLAARKTGRRYTYLDLKGQDCLIGCATSAQFEALKRSARLEFEWLA
jgi:hypothetical protein